MIRTGWQRMITSAAQPGAWAPLLIALGLLLRLRQYLFNRSLWVDEAMLALNIVNRSWGELLGPLDHTQSAPVGFLLLQRAAILALGNSELSLRLFPLAAGILSLFVLGRVARVSISRGAAPVSIGLFAILEWLVQYSSEAKQYSSDVLVTLLLLLIAFRVLPRRLTAGQALGFGLAGAVSMWFSHPSVFILAGVGTCLFLFHLERKDWSGMSSVAFMCLLWVLSFAGSYWLTLRDLGQHQGLQRYWQGEFAPFPPASAADLRWYFEAFFGVFRWPTGFFLKGVAALCFLIGCHALWTTERRKCLLLLSPIPFTLIASMMQRYPFDGRLLLFIVPVLLLLIAEGAGFVWSRTRSTAPAAGWILLVLLFVAPALQALTDAVQPPGRSEVRPLLASLDELWEEGDLLYVYYGAVPAFEYYMERDSFHVSPHILGSISRDDWFDYETQLEELCGRGRVWILLSHVFSGKGVNEGQLILKYLDRFGSRTGVWLQTGASLYLYDLSMCRRPESAGPEGHDPPRSGRSPHESRGDRRLR